MQKVLGTVVILGVLAIPDVCLAGEKLELVCGAEDDVFITLDENKGQLKVEIISSQMSWEGPYIKKMRGAEKSYILGSVTLQKSANEPFMVFFHNNWAGEACQEL